MSIFRKNLNEVLSSVIPIVALVLLTTLFIVPAPSELIIRFVIGSILIMVGLTIFLVGVSTGVERIATKLGTSAQHIGSKFVMFLFGFLIGFVITVAEPDLVILAKSIEASVGINSYIMVVAVSIGVGTMVGLGFLRILTNFKIKNFFMIAYAIVLVLFILQNDAFRNFAFDASGATTGAMTTPFLLALALGVSRLKGSYEGERDSFGMVGIASIGPVIAVLTLGFFVKGEAVVVEEASGAFNFLHLLLEYTKESVVALLPITLLYLIFNKISFKLHKKKFWSLMRGLLYSFIGLVLFLTGVNAGFTDLAKVLGQDLFSKGPWVFILFSFLTGLVVVLAEPAVHSLVDQVDEVTSGSVDRRLLRIALSVGVGVAVMLSALRITISNLQLWMYLVPGFLIAILLMKKVDPLFVGIAFDAGGVASGPMTATFVLALMQGAASVSPGADPVVDGFGVIASVAMAPVVSLMILGILYNTKNAKNKR
ncbi:MAG: DUF1538 domain-containing protein [Ezakiella sp.]|nr:DUF1538 domain-containing protein [Ezakiella sp.]